MFSYIRKSLARKRARRVTGTYPAKVDAFNLATEGKAEFANWTNPLIAPKTLTQAEVNFFRRFAPLGSFCIDIGANIGDTTVPMALAVGAKGLTLGFEPNPLIFEILKVNASLNKTKTNIIPLAYAVTEQAGEFYYSSSEASFGNGGISENLEDAKRHGKYNLPNKITGINLLAYLGENHPNELERLSLIKIDVEGRDLEVIRSVSELIRQRKPVVIAECFTEATPAERAQLFQSMSDLGYSLSYFEDFTENTPTQLLSAGDMNNWKNFNFYAVPK